MTFSMADYETHTGKIQRVMVGPSEDWMGDLATNMSRLVLTNHEVINAAVHYVSGEALQIRQPIPLVTTNILLIANGTDETIISGIPEGVQVEWPDGQTDIVTDGEISFSVDLPGTYTFRFTAVPYLDKEITVEAIATT